MSVLIVIGILLLLIQLGLSPLNIAVVAALAIAPMLLYGCIRFVMHAFAKSSSRRQAAPTSR